MQKSTCIFPTGGDTTRKILMVALRKSSLLSPLSSLAFGLAPPFAALPQLPLKLILRGFSPSFVLSLFRTPLLEEEEEVEVELEAGFCLATTSTFLTEALFVLSLKDRALK